MDPPRPRRRRRERRTLGPRLVALLLVGSFVLPLAAAGTAGASGLSPTYGFRTSTGQFVLPFYQGLFQANSIYPGTVVFGDLLYLQVTPLGFNTTDQITTVQNASGLSPLYSNLTVPIDAGDLTTVTVTLPSSTAERTVRLCVSGGCITFDHLTPVTLIPSGVINVGGIDLIAFAITVETAIFAFPLILLARYVTRKVLWSPRAHVWLVVPHIVGAFLFGLAFDYQFFDETFGGLAFLSFPVIFDVLLFFWSLHLFNVARPVEVLRPDPQGGHRLRYNRWRIFVGELPDGTKVLVGTRWRDWLARLCGHFPVLVPADIEGTAYGAPAVAPVLTHRTEALGERRDLRARAFRSRPSRETPLEDFQIATERSSREKDPPTSLYWVDSDRWLSDEMPHLSFHRDVPVPAKFKDGLIVQEATVKRRLAFPHYVDPPVEISLADLHYYDTPAAALGWISAERSFRRVNQIRVSNHALRTNLLASADDAAQRQVSEIYQLFGSERFPLTDEEAAEDTRSEAARPGQPEKSDDTDRPKRPGDRAVGAEGGR